MGVLNLILSGSDTLNGSFLLPPTHPITGTIEGDHLDRLQEFGKKMLIKVEGACHKHGT
jgi:hypothetical protein